MSKGAASVPVQPKGTTAIGTAFSWPRVISMTSCAFAAGAISAATAAIANNLASLSILFLRTLLSTLPA